MKKIVIPIVVSLAAVFGFVIGSVLSKNELQHTQKVSNLNVDGKLDLLLNLIDLQYVDTVNRDELVESAIPKILAELDPHSVYIPAEDLQIVNDDLDKSFSGIGVQFNIQKDTIMIVAVISGGPSERLGILPGDRIVTVDDSLFVGPAITNDKVMKRLRGPKGTKVKVGVKRSSSEELLSFEIVRGDIPLHSIDASYMLQDKVGYVKVSKFGSGTYDEFVEALTNLRIEGAERYIVDLRGNSGGYLDAAILMTNEFLKEGDLIVYTEGKAEKRRDAVADGRGVFAQTPVAVLIDEWSASASEIFAGAIQDNDRGVVVGRRSFGKGLVQQQIPLRDGSAIRLTIARYHTPSGRCIQKPYSDKDEYDMDILNRYLHGEMDDKDSIKALPDSLKFFTTQGRVVYGGGGISPDVFVPRDTIGMTSYYTKIYNGGILYDYTFEYVDKNREKLALYKDFTSLLNYLNTQNLADELVQFAQGRGIPKNDKMYAESKALMQNRIKAYILRSMLGDEAFYPVFNENDIVIRVALQELSNNNSLPNVARIK
ncbi:MAG: S41 family peptidase [Paludibacteraceae bacterium]|nr:S41 family peptidase [Paludibacteraceae bacterium]MBQ9100255.1 S41 family peptidase [Paludibacteraceae bacterium]